MTNTLTHNIVSPSNPTLDELRDAVGDAHKRQYGAVKVYAVKLCSELPEDWHEVEHTDLSEEAKPTLAEATKFRDVLRKAGHKNPSVVWTRVRAEGRAHAIGATDEAGKKSNKRSIQLRFLEDIPALYKAGKREESLTTQQQLVMTHLASAITAMGLDLSQLTK